MAVGVGVGVSEMAVGEMAVGEMLWVWVRWWILTIRWRMVGGGGDGNQVLINDAAPV